MMQAVHPSLAARQVYPGELTNKDPISSVLARTGQESRITRDHYAMTHGRSYSGFGTDVSLNDPFPGNPNVGDLEYADNEAMDAMEAEDDVAGSGIFDQPGRRSTIHSTLGVFADHPSLPGYAAREQPFAVSQDVTDPIHHADVVYLPAGGMTYVERGGRRVDYLDRERYVPPPVTATTEGAASGFGDMAFARQFQPTRLARPLPVRPIVNPLQLRQGIGADAPPAADWKTYVAVGAVVGVAAAILVGTLKIKPGRGRKGRR